MSTATAKAVFSRIAATLVAMLNTDSPSIYLLASKRRAVKPPRPVM